MSQPFRDRIENKSFKYLREKLNSEAVNATSKKQYREAYLVKAKSERNWKEMFYAYKEILHQVEGYARVQYADSMILTAQHIGERDLLGSAYLTKGIIYYEMKSHNNALDNYLIADDYLGVGADRYLANKVKYNIGQIKYYLGYYEEAISIFLECVDYYKDVNDTAYLASLHSLGLCYAQISNYDQSSATNALGISEATSLEVFNVIPRFVNSEGINQYFKNNYDVSLAKLFETLPHLVKKKDFASISITNFYIGKNYWSRNEQNTAVEYFKKVDDSYNEHGYIRPDTRESYEFLIDYCKEKDDLAGHAYFIRQLLTVDRFLDNNYKYLSKRIYREYDAKKLVAAKKEVEDHLKFLVIISVFFICTIIILIGLVFYLVNRLTLNKRKFTAIIAKRDRLKSATDLQKTDDSLDINPEIIRAIQRHLDAFESQKKFLRKNIKLTTMAKMFDSNIVYVSKVILHYKQKKSVNYVNDLRIDYIVEKIRESNKFRNYTNNALATEAGFKTAQHFTTAFVKRMGHSPTTYINTLKKSNPLTKNG